MRAEILAAAWETFSVLLFISAVLPAAFDTAWPSLLFVGGLAITVATSSALLRRGRRGWAALLRVPLWLLGVAPLYHSSDRRMLVATCGFGVMAAAIRLAIYRRTLEPTPEGSSLRAELGENAAVAGIVGGHVMLLFSVAFLRTASQLVFRAWWEIVPLMAILGTSGFTLAIVPATNRVVPALKAGREAPREGLTQALRQAESIPRRLFWVNFAVWLTCTTTGVLYIRTGPEVWRWSDAVMQVAFGSLFAWGVSAYQRGWHEDTMRPAIEALRAWTGTEAERDEVSLRRRMLSEFGLPLLFAITLSLFASIGLYRTLGEDLSLQEDFNAITALVASFTMVVLAVGGVFMRAARQLAGPLGTLSRAADRVASGELDEVVPAVQGPREVSDLGRSIEAMREALARTIGDLEQERAGLETRVAERTAELRAALDELTKAQTALIHGERLALIGELMAGLAHEIYNPLSAIAGSVSSLDRLQQELAVMLASYREAEALLPEARRREVAERRAELDIDGALADLAGVAKVVDSATRRSVELVQSLKRFSRAGDEPRPSDLRDGLRETIALLGHRARERQVAIVERYGELPPVVCRAGEINQVFMNLLSNAIQAARRTVEIVTEQDGDRALVVVSDDGEGVSADIAERIFDPFFTTKPRGQGTGLGLSISGEIVRRHGGTLSVARAAEPLGGARFECSLPLVPPSPPSASRAAPSSLPDRRAGRDSLG